MPLLTEVPIYSFVESRPLEDARVLARLDDEGQSPLLIERAFAAHLADGRSHARASIGAGRVQRRGGADYSPRGAMCSPSRAPGLVNLHPHTDNRSPN